jgi:hypothetical protein
VATPTAETRALTNLLAVERGGMMPLRAVGGVGDDVYAALHRAGLVTIDRASGRYVLTSAGRARAEGTR